MKPPPLYIRDVLIDPPLILAPMEGVTDLTFRRLVRRVGGCGLTVTEFIPGRSLSEAHGKALRMAAFDSDERPVSVQVYGRDPAVMADAARYAADLGADIVDLNMGCPSKKVVKNSGGSALMREPSHALEIVRAMRAAVDLPFTVKMRAGWDVEHRNAPELAYQCQEEGVEMVAVHWRTRQDLYGGVRELETIASVVDRLQIPVVGNGDVIDVASAQEMLTLTGCAGLMIGRGAVRDPWVFRQIERDMNGEPPLEVNAEEKRRVLVAYYEALRLQCDNDRHTLGRMKKIGRYFTGQLPGAERLRRAFLLSQTVESALSEVHAFFDGLAVGAPESTEPPKAPRSAGQQETL